MTRFTFATHAAEAHIGRFLRLNSLLTLVTQSPNMSPYDILYYDVSDREHQGAAKEKWQDGEYDDRGASVW
jgi:hypothetical protein